MRKIDDNEGGPATKHRRIVALSISVDYADYLQSIRSNADSFDAWYILSSPFDKKTASVCATYGFILIESTHLGSHTSIDVVSLKWTLINEGLDFIASKENGPNTWCILLDADILLPKEFRKRIADVKLTPGHLYGLSIRLICSSTEAFIALRDREPWDDGELHSSILGFFNLFSLWEFPNRYVVRAPRRNVEHDDELFAMQFAQDRRHLLPISCLHLGSKGVNWFGRRSKAIAYLEHADESGEAILPIMEERCKAAVLVGSFPSARLPSILKLSEFWYILDEHRIFEDTDDQFLQADRRYLREKLHGQLAMCGCPFSIRSEGYNPVSLIEDSSLELAYVCGTPQPARLAAFWIQYSQKLTAEALIGGDTFDYAIAPSSACAIAQIFGSPRRSRRSNSWLSFKSKAARIQRISQRYHSNAAIFLYTATDNQEEVTVATLFSFRRNWGGELYFVTRGKLSDSLTMVCLLLDVEVIQGEPASIIEGSKRAHSADPFGVMLVESGVLLARKVSLEELWDSADNCSDCAEPPFILKRSGTDLQKRVPKIIGSSDYSAADSIPLIDFRLGLERTSNRAWEFWCMLEMRAARFFRRNVHSPAFVTIGTIAQESELGDFQRTWLTWHFLDRPVIVVLINPPDEFWLPDAESTTVLRVTSSSGNGMKEAFTLLVENCHTQSIALISPLAKALPGAELWPDLKADECAFHVFDVDDGDSAQRGNQFEANQGLAIAPKEALKNFARRTELPETLAGSLLLLLGRLAAMTVRRNDGRGQGWDLSSPWLWRGPIKTCYKHFYRVHRGIKRSFRPAIALLHPSNVELLSRLEEEATSNHADYSVYVSPSSQAQEEGRGAEDGEIAPWCKQSLYTELNLHMSLLQSALENGHNGLIVIDSRICLEKGWYARVVDICTRLPQDWFQLHFSSLDVHGGMPYSTEAQIATGLTGSRAVAYSYAGLVATAACLEGAGSCPELKMNSDLHPFGFTFVARTDTLL